MKILFLVIYVATIFIATTTANAQNHQNFASGLDQGIIPAIKILNTVGKKGSDRNKYDLNIPTDIAVNENQIIIVDASSHQIKLFDLDGKFNKIIGKKGSNSSEFYYPYSIDIDSMGNIYVSDLGNDRIQLFDPNGIHLSNIQFTTGNMRINNNNTISVTKAHGYFDYAIQNFDIFSIDSNILLYSAKGKLKYSLSEKLKYNNNQMDNKGNEVYVDFDNNENLLIAYLYSNLIEKYDSYGNLVWKKKHELNYSITKPLNIENQTNTFKEILMNKCHSGIAVDEKGRIWVVTLNRQLNSEENVTTNLNAMRGFDGKKKITISVSDYMGPSTSNAFKIDVLSPDGNLITSIPLTHFVDNIRIYKNKLYLIDSFRSKQISIYKIVD